MAEALRLEGLAARIDAALPQTQCTRCGYPDCAAYAQAIASSAAGMDQCPPGGAEGIARLASILQQPLRPLNPVHGSEVPRTLASIDENWCIGCTLCIKACPTDAILGAIKLMHTVIAAHCTGCELCVPVCPVDCIELINASGSATGWAAHTAAGAGAGTALRKPLRSRSMSTTKRRPLRPPWRVPVPSAQPENTAQRLLGASLRDSAACQALAASLL